METVVSDEWRYGDYILMDPGRPKLERLRLHVQEVAQRLAGTAGITSHTIEGSGWTREGLSGYLHILREDLRELEADLGIRSDGGFFAARGRN